MDDHWAALESPDTTTETLEAAEQALYRRLLSTIRAGGDEGSRGEVDRYMRANLVLLQACHTGHEDVEDEERQEVTFSGAMQALRLQVAMSPDKFPMRLLKEIVNGVVSTPTASPLLTQAMNEYSDICYYGLKALEDVLAEDQHQVDLSTVFLLLSALSMNKDDQPAFTATQYARPWKRRAAAFSSAWLAFIQLLNDTDRALSLPLRRQVLEILDSRVLPWLHRSAAPLMYDFLFVSFTAGGTEGWLALSSLFVLVQKHRLTVPVFYDALYAKLTPLVLHSRHRRRFLRLLGTFLLRSTHIGEEQLRRFVKRVVHLAIATPMEVTAWMVPFVYNAIKTHPTLVSLIHDDSAVHCEGEGEGTHCNALYELEVLFRHYCGAISKHSSVLKERFVRPPYNLDKYCKEAVSTEAWLKDELTHKWSKAPPLNADRPSILFQ